MVANGKLPRGQTKVTFQTGETRSLSFCGFVCNWSWPSIHLILSKFRSRISFLLICDFSLMQNRVSGTKTKHDLLDSEDILLKKADKYINNKIRWCQHKSERMYSILNGQFDKLCKVMSVGYCLAVWRFPTKAMRVGCGTLDAVFFLSFFQRKLCVSCPPSCGPQQTTEREIIKFKNLSNS